MTEPFPARPQQRGASILRCWFRIPPVSPARNLCRSASLTALHQPPAAEEAGEVVELAAEAVVAGAVVAARAAVEAEALLGAVVLAEAEVTPGVEAPEAVAEAEAPAAVAAAVAAVAAAAAA